MHRNWLRIEEYQEIDSPEIDTDEFRPIVLSEDYLDIETQWQVAINYLQPFVFYRSGQNDTHITANLAPTLTQFTADALRDLQRELRELDGQLLAENNAETTGMPQEVVTAEVPNEQAQEAISTVDEVCQDPSNLARHKPPTAGVNLYPERVPTVLPHPDASEEAFSEVGGDGEFHRLYVTHDIPADAPPTTDSEQLLKTALAEPPTKSIVTEAIVCPGCETFGVPTGPQGKQWNCTTRDGRCRVTEYKRDSFVQSQGSALGDVPSVGD